MINRDKSREERLKQTDIKGYLLKLFGDSVNLQVIEALKKMYPIQDIIPDSNLETIYYNAGIQSVIKILESALIKKE